MRYEIRPLVAWADPETSPRRGSHIFKASWRDTLTLLGDEIDKLGGDLAVMQIDVREGDIRNDGMLRANAKVGHPGVAISFESAFGPLRYATDAHERQYGYGKLDGWQANVRAIALSLVALRAVDRYGVTRRGEQYTGWRQIESSAPSARRGEDLVKEHGDIRKALFATHPDHGGNASDFADVQAFRETR